MAKTPDRPDFEPSGFFALRTPLLPFDELEAWSAGLEAPAEAAAEAETPEPLVEALAGDRRRLRSRLGELIERPEIREALFVASPALASGLEAWRRDPDGKKGRRAEVALVRYFQRMASRATPFGLFSGCSLGTVGDNSELRLAARDAYRRHTRLDMDYLFALTEDLGRDPGLRRVLRYRPNSSLYHAAGRLRYVESRLDGKARSHHLVAVEATDYLEHTLRRARQGATAADLGRSLAGAVSAGAEPGDAVTIEEAEEFINELVDSQILVSSLSPAVTGREPIHDLIDQLGEHDVTHPASECLEGVRAALANLDDAGLGAEGERYRAVARRLEELPTRVELPRLFQVDMDKPVAGAVLGPEVLAEIRRGVDVLHRLAGRPPEDELARFRQEFVERYGEAQALPLVEVLDEEIGIGFGGSRGSEASPLLEALVLPPRPGEATVPWGAQARLLLGKLEEALAEGAREIELTNDELAPFGDEAAPPLPDAFQVMATLAAPSPQALARGEFQLALTGAGGPSGARLLGRFCHADEDLRRAVEGHLRQEEALEPEALFVEVVHLPEGRIGNVLSRPLLREHEISFLGRGGAPEQRQIPITDLLVTVSGDAVVVSSKSLGRRVIPRLTSAHNFSRPGSLGIYRFLGALQSQGVRPGLGWSWGALEGLSFLPRVTSGRLVLSRARWRVDAREIEELVRGDAARRFRAICRWRSERRLPRLVALLDGDNELLVDLDNILSIDAFLALVKKRATLTLAELFPGPEALCAAGPEGRFVHQLVIPFVRRREAVPRPVPARSEVPVRRTFPPGSEWLYAKLYTGSATADQVLREVVGPVARQALACGAADRWFFIRYSDPHWHLRVRFHGEPRHLHGEVLPRLHQAVAPLLEDGQIWRFQLDTYEREVERYGGAEGVGLAERLAHADSEAVLAIVENLEGDEGAAARWRLALRGLDLLLCDFGLESQAKLDTLRQMQESFAREFRAGAGLKKQLAARLRQERPALNDVLEPGYDVDHPLAPGFAALVRRSEQLAPIVAELKAREGAQRLTEPLARLAPSYLHMFVNRLIRSQGRVHELVLYDFLYRLSQSRAARARARAKA